MLKKCVLICSFGNLRSYTQELQLIVFWAQMELVRLTFHCLTTQYSNPTRYPPRYRDCDLRLRLK